MNYRKISKRKILLLIGDLVIIFASVNFAYAVRFGNLSNKGKLDKYIYIWIFLSIAYVFSFYVFDQYNIRIKFRTNRSILLYIGSLVLVIIIIIVYFYLFPFSIGRGIFVFSLIFTSVFSFLWRNVYPFVFRLALPKRNVLIVGDGDKEEELYDLIKGNKEYEVIGVLDDNNSKENTRFKYLGKIEKLQDIVNKYRVDDIITTLDPIRSDDLIHELVNCKMKGISIYDIPTFYEGLIGKLPVFKIKEKWLFYSNGFERLGDKLYKRNKRILDFLISSCILIVSLPFSLLIILLIKTDSKGPVFYIQERLGENEKPFRLIKFRTMVKNAEKGGPKWTKEKDPRVTRVGRILRKIRLDELPQLANIIKGDMSIIGPRPEREYFIEKLTKKIPFYSLRFSVKPGLSGWAQVNYRYGSSVEDAMEKLMYDLYYIKNMSFFLDLRIMLRTIRITLLWMGR